MPKIKHAVFIRFKPETSQTRIHELFAVLEGFPNTIPGLLDFSGGPNSSVEGLNKGYTHGFVMTFADAASRDAYLTNPEHEAFNKMVFPELEGGLDGAVVVDWEVPSS